MKYHIVYSYWPVGKNFEPSVDGAKIRKEIVAVTIDGAWHEYLWKKENHDVAKYTRMDIDDIYTTY